MIRCADCGTVDYALDGDGRCWVCRKFYLQDSADTEAE